MLAEISVTDVCRQPETFEPLRGKKRWRRHLLSSVHPSGSQKEEKGKVQYYITGRAGESFVAVSCIVYFSVATDINKMIANVAKLKFYNGNEVPIFGLGTWKASFSSRFRNSSFDLDIFDCNKCNFVINLAGNRRYMRMYM